MVTQCLCFPTSQELLTNKVLPEGSSFYVDSLVAIGVAKAPPCLLNPFGRPRGRSAGATRPNFFYYLQTFEP